MEKMLDIWEIATVLVQVGLIIEEKVITPSFPMLDGYVNFVLGLFDDANLRPYLVLHERYNEANAAGQRTEYSWSLTQIRTCTTCLCLDYQGEAQATEQSDRIPVIRLNRDWVFV